jgi:hypothetical protein
MPAPGLPGSFIMWVLAAGLQGAAGGWPGVAPDPGVRQRRPSVAALAQSGVYLGGRAAPPVGAGATLSSASGTSTRLSACSGRVIVLWPRASTPIPTLALPLRSAKTRVEAPPRTRLKTVLVVPFSSANSMLTVWSGSNPRTARERPALSRIVIPEAPPPRTEKLKPPLLPGVCIRKRIEPSSAALQEPRIAPVLSRSRNCLASTTLATVPGNP